MTVQNMWLLDLNICSIPHQAVRNYCISGAQLGQYEVVAVDHADLHWSSEHHIITQLSGYMQVDGYLCMLSLMMYNHTYWSQKDAESADWSAINNLQFKGLSSFEKRWRLLGGSLHQIPHHIFFSPGLINALIAQYTALPICMAIFDISVNTCGFISSCSM